MQRTNQNIPDAMGWSLSSGDALVVLDAGYRVLRWNDAATRLFGLTAAAAVGRRCYELLHTEDRFGNRVCMAACPVMTLVQQGDHVPAIECRVRGRPSPDRRVSMSTVALHHADGSIQAVLHVIRPIAAPAPLASSSRGAAAPPAEVPAIPTKEALTRREAEVWSLLCAGASTAQIGERLSVTRKTAANYVHRLLDKLGVHSRLEAVLLSLHGRRSLPP